MTVRVGITVGHCVDGQHHVVAQIVGAARRRFHTDARRDARQDDLGRAALAQVIVQGGAKERAPSLFGDDVIVGAPLQFGTSSAQSAGRENLGLPESVRPGAPPVTLTRTTGRPCSRKARASRATRSTISAAGCTVGRPTMPFCRSITIKAATESSCVSGMVFLSVGALADRFPLAVLSSVVTTFRCGFINRHGKSSTPQKAVARFHRRAQARASQPASSVPRQS